MMVDWIKRVSMPTLSIFIPQVFTPFTKSKCNRWKQMYYGWITKQWAHYLVVNHPELDPIHLLTKMLGLIWTHVLELWKSHNNDHHAVATQYPPIWYPTCMVPMLHANIYWCIYPRADLPSHQRRTTNQTQTWIQNAKVYIQTKLKILIKQQQTHSQDICQFFPAH